MFGEEDGEQSIVFEKLDNSLTEVAVTVMLELVMGSSTAEGIIIIIIIHCVCFIYSPHNVPSFHADKQLTC